MQAIPVNSGVPQRMQRCPSSSPRQLLIGAAKRRGEICPSNYFRVFLGHARFGFLVKKIFLAIKNKIHFFLVDFETGF
jgi:hypothetical protein